MQNIWLKSFPVSQVFTVMTWIIEGTFLLSEEPAIQREKRWQLHIISFALLFKIRFPEMSLCCQKGCAVMIAHWFTLHQVLVTKRWSRHRPRPWDPQMQGKRQCHVANILRHWRDGCRGPKGIREGFTEAVTLQVNLEMKLARQRQGEGCSIIIFARFLALYIQHFI